MNDALRRELLDLEAADHALREELARDGSLFGGYNPRMEALHRRNAERLRQIIAGHGWPTRTLVGEDGAAAAQRIVQHAIGEPGFMRRCAVLIRAAVAEGEADAAMLAMLEDRIRMFEGRPQLYGTQYDWNDTRDVMIPIGGVEDGVDERRRAVGLPPMVWSHAPPADEPSPTQSDEQRQAELDAWARKVGWRR